MINEERQLFILAGNGPYDNRGCEAIVRGTVKILREHFRNPHFVCLSHFQSEEQYRIQRLQETDETIVHLATRRLRKNDVFQNFWKPEVWLCVYRHFFDPTAMRYEAYRDMIPYLDTAVAVLSVGGDNYSLDYGVPTLFTALDDIVLEKRIPLAIWGASVGPFDRMPDYEEYMGRHLRDVTGIFARESSTIDYLKSIDIDKNVYKTADPAFLMNPEKPESIEDSLPIDEEAIGINLSPLMAKYVTGGDLKAWASMAASIIEDVAEKTEMPIFLIPHVTILNSNDHEFMLHVLSLIKRKYSDITLIPPTYNAAETKWIISQMVLFAGARTHSTIAALSSGVPTLSFAYSIKARGINWDLFGHFNYCINTDDLGSRMVSDRIASMMENKADIKRDLNERTLLAQRRALNAGGELKRLVEV